MLARHGLALRVGLVLRPARATRGADEEIAAVGPHLELLAGNGANVMVYGEVADSIQGAPQPLYQRPRSCSDDAVATPTASG